MQRQSYQVKTVLEKKGARKKTFLAFKYSLGNPLSRSPRVDFEIVMGDFNEMGQKEKKCRVGRNGCLGGFWTPDGGNVPTLYNYESDRILYNYGGAKQLKTKSFKTFSVLKNGKRRNALGMFYMRAIVNFLYH